MTARLQDLRAVVSATELERFNLYGGLHGAATAIEYAAARPDRVSRLILYMPYAKGAEYRTAAARFESFRQRAYDDPKEWEEYTLAVAASNLGYGSPHAIEDAARRFRDSMSPASLRAFEESIPDIDVSASLSRVQSPTMVMYRAGSFAGMLSLAMARSVAAGIPGSTFVHTAGQRGVLWSEDETQAVERFIGIPPEDEAATPVSPSSSAKAGPGTAVTLRSRRR